MTPQADIVERLRKQARYPFYAGDDVADDMTDAADTIERHRAAIAMTDVNVERLARVMVPLLSGGQEDEFGRNLPDAQFDTIPADWQDAYRGYARAILAAQNEAANS